MNYSLSLDPVTNASVQMKLYRNVKNVPDLRKRIVGGSLDCCIVKPSLIVDPFQIVVAANKALVAEKMTTKTVYTELLFNLSISKNITQSLQKFGIDDKEKEILLVVINKNDSDGNLDKIAKEINGEEVDISVLNKFTNVAEVKKAYKLSDIEVKHFPLVDSVVSRIATKDFI